MALMKADVRAKKSVRGKAKQKPKSTTSKKKTSKKKTAKRR